jgi:hypothetical protein
MFDLLKTIVFGMKMSNGNEKKKSKKAIVLRIGDEEFDYGRIRKSYTGNSTTKWQTSLTALLLMPLICVICICIMYFIYIYIYIYIGWLGRIIGSFHLHGLQGAKRMEFIGIPSNSPLRLYLSSDFIRYSANAIHKLLFFGLQSLYHQGSGHETIFLPSPEGSTLFTFRM